MILQAMAKLPAERYTTAEDLRADLDRFLARSDRCSPRRTDKARRSTPW